ncbi:MAG: lipoprotein [Paraglaciecola sp.]|nr:lipoprotein [Paraglaciecola sp.]NCT49644.1 lipoprotein [Paraglaciecola sp.]
MHRRNRKVVFILLFALGVTACGQKGPLYLPTDPPSNQNPPEEPSSSPAQENN